MRMDATQPKTAAAVINQYSEKALAELFRHNADLLIAKRLARLIVQARNQARITTTGQLCAAVQPVLPVRQRPGYLSRIFQAVRMEVNEEINELQQGLAQALDLLVPGGRVVTIAYHSGEDRQVKHLFQEKARGCICPPRFPRCQCGRKPTLKILTRKAVVPAPEELARNLRARSAKLRAAEKI
jgi:16S rRNA (cytosine1402-N4)-methyltransferase